MGKAGLYKTRNTIIKKITDEILKKREENLVEKLYFDCEYCGEKTKLKDGILITAQEYWKIKENNITINMPWLVCENCQK
jgi:hypothetical protein